MSPDDWLTVLSAEPNVRRQQGVSTDVLAAAESMLGTALPLALRDLYLASDGVWDEPGRWNVIWPLAQVVERNRTAWDIETRARRDWVGFGDDGTGAPFCVRRTGGDEVFHWSPIEQRASILASDAIAFWQEWVTASLPPP